MTTKPTNELSDTTTATPTTTNASPLDGTLTRDQRILIAQDVITTLQSSQTKIVIKRGSYVSYYQVPPDIGVQFNSSLLHIRCHVCARGMLFLKSVDRFNDCMITAESDELSSIAVERTFMDWGVEQAEMIESAFEMEDMSRWWGSSARLFSKESANSCEAAAGSYYHIHNSKRRMIAICENIITNNGEFKPETETV